MFLLLFISIHNLLVLLETCGERSINLNLELLFPEGELAGNALNILLSEKPHGR